MKKHYVSFSAEPLRWACNESFFLAKRRMPKCVTRNVSDRNLARIFGFPAGLGVALFGKHVVYPFLQNAGLSASLEDVVAWSVAFTAGAWIGVNKMPGIKARTSDKYDHPVYSAGRNSVIYGAIAIGLYELLF